MLLQQLCTNYMVNLFGVLFGKGRSQSKDKNTNQNKRTSWASISAKIRLSRKSLWELWQDIGGLNGDIRWWHTGLFKIIGKEDAILLLLSRNNDSNIVFTYRCQLRHGGCTSDNCGKVTTKKLKHYFKNSINKKHKKYAFNGIFVCNFHCPALTQFSK